MAASRGDRHAEMRFGSGRRAEGVTLLRRVGDLAKSLRGCQWMYGCGVVKGHLTLAAFSEISIVMSLPSSSARGFCLTTVARAGEPDEKVRARKFRGSGKVREGSCPMLWEVTALEAKVRPVEDFARHCWKKAAGVCIRATRRDISTRRNVGCAIV